ncbi:MAG: tryptophan-rich hypothetical protein [Candidatus Endobugula sp.]|jgi:tryptophan-rich hypothetical protein
MNNINPRKLPNSKWTAVNPASISGAKEKHFITTNVEFDEEGGVIACEIEAVLSRRKISIEWRELMDTSCWLFGWK